MVQGFRAHFRVEGLYFFGGLGCSFTVARIVSTARFLHPKP